MIIKTILFLCLSKFNYNLNNASFTGLDQTINKCTDAVAACYFTEKKDPIACVNAYIQRSQQ